MCDLGENSDSQLLCLLEWFVTDALGGPMSTVVQRDRWDTWDTLQKSLLSRRKCGFDLLMQVIFTSHMSFVQQQEEDLEPGSSKATQSMAESFCSVAPMVPMAPRPNYNRKVFFAEPGGITPEPAKRRVLAPETMAVDAVNCSFDDTCKIVPETQTNSDHEGEQGGKHPAPMASPDKDMLIEEDEDDDDEGERRKQQQASNSRKSVKQPQKKRSRKSDIMTKSKEELERERDEAIRAKYPKLDDIVFKAHDTTSFDNRGVFGVGESPNFRAPANASTMTPEVSSKNDNKEVSLMEDESPSIISKRSWNTDKSRHQAAAKADSDDDFSDSPSSSSRVNKMASKKKKKPHQPVTNKWGLEVSEATASQVKRSEGMKQGKLDAFFGPAAGGADKRKKAEVDSDLQRALEISRQEHLAKKEAEEKHPASNNAQFVQEAFKDERVPLSTLDDSFNVVPEARAPQGKVLGKARMLLAGVNCRECYDWYEDHDLTESELEKIMNKCSRHRKDKDEVVRSPTTGRRVPEAVFDSPKERWEIDMKEDREGNEPEKTQIGSPLRTRKVRREERQKAAAVAARKKL